MMQGPGFIFGGNTGLSYENLQRNRKALEQERLRQRDKTPKNIGEGFASIGSQLANALRTRQLQKQEKEQQEGFQSDYAKTFVGTPAGPTPGQEGFGVLANAGQPAQAAPPVSTQQLMEFAADPRANPGQRSVLAMMLQQRIQSEQPGKPIQVGNSLVMKQPDGSFQPVYEGQGDPTNTMQEYQAARAQGYQGSMLDYQTALKQAGRSQTNVNVSSGATQETAFSKEAGKQQAQRWGSIYESGLSANQSSLHLDKLEGLLQQPGMTGLMPAMQVWAKENLGINTLAPTQEAAVALLSQLIPSQRAPGSGPMSDKDLEMYRNALPQMMNSAEGNSLIVSTMRRINAYQRETGEIASLVINGHITRNEGDQRLQSLANPLDPVRNFVGGSNAQPAQPGQPPAATPNGIGGIQAVSPPSALDPKTEALLRKYGQ